MIFKKGDSVINIVEEEIQNLSKLFDMVSVHKANVLSLTSSKYGTFTIWNNDVTYKEGSFPFTHICFKYDAVLNEYEITISNDETDSMIIFKFM